jgi:hypothetical protein
MIDLLAGPGTPYYLAALCGALIMVWGQRLARPQAAHGLITVGGGRARWATGQLAGLVLALTVLGAGLAAGATGSQRLLVLMGAGAAFLWVGVVLPRRERVAAEKRRRALRKLTPGFLAYVRVSLAGYDTPAVILERYGARLDRRSAPMRQLTAAALDEMQRQRVRPFTALRDQARLTGCRELIDLAEALAQAENEGADVTAALEQHEQTLLAVLEDEFRRMLKRRTLYLLLLVAVSVVVGILGNLLFVMLGSVIFGGGV